MLDNHTTDDKTTLFLALNWQVLLTRGSEYCDMTPESRNSSLLGSCGKQIPAEIYMHARIEEILSMHQRGKHASVMIEELLGDGVFCVVHAKIL
jgi:hypothetical protein